MCFLGNSGVGKTSLLCLLKGRNIPNERNPTVGLEIENSLLNGNKVNIWDLGGQERYQFMWEDFLKGAGLTILVCDSTEENVKKTREIFEKFSKYLDTKIIAIANKQDLPGALSAKKVQKKLGIKTYGMSAIRLELSERMRNILEYEISTN